MWRSPWGTMRVRGVPKWPQQRNAKAITTRGMMIFMVGWFAGGTDSHRRWARRQEGIMAKLVIMAKPVKFLIL